MATINLGDERESRSVHNLRTRLATLAAKFAALSIITQTDITDWLYEFDEHIQDTRDTRAVCGTLGFIGGLVFALVVFRTFR